MWFKGCGSQPRTFALVERENEDSVDAAGVGGGGGVESENPHGTFSMTQYAPGRTAAIHDKSHPTAGVALFRPEVSDRSDRSD